MVGTTRAEVANNTPGVLDVPPFTATGTANSFFDVFTELSLDGTSWMPAQNSGHVGLMAPLPPPT